MSPFLRRVPQRHHLAVDAARRRTGGRRRCGSRRRSRRRGAARQRLDLAARREAVDLLRVEVDLQVLDELLRIADLLLPLEQLPQPVEVLLVALARRPALPCTSSAPRCLPRRSRCISSVRIWTSKGRPRSLIDRRVQRLVAVRPRHRDEVLDPARDRLPGLVDDAERGVAVLHASGDDAEGDEVVDLVEVDLLPLQLQVDAVEALDAAVDLRARAPAPRRASAGWSACSSSMTPSVARRLLSTLASQRLVGDAARGAERELLELVLDLAHAQPVGDGA